MQNNYENNLKKSQYPCNIYQKKEKNGRSFILIELLALKFTF